MAASGHRCRLWHRRHQPAWTCGATTLTGQSGKPEGDTGCLFKDAWLSRACARLGYSGAALPVLRIHAEALWHRATGDDLYSGPVARFTFVVLFAGPRQSATRCQQAGRGAPQVVRQGHWRGFPCPESRAGAWCTACTS